MKFFQVLIFGIITFSTASQEVYMPEIQVETSSSEEASLLVYQETTPGMRQPVIEGLMGDKIALTLDNNKYSNSLFRSGPNQYFSWIPQEFILYNTVNETLLNASLGGTVNSRTGIKDTSLEIGVSSNTLKTFASYRDSNLSIGIVYTDNQNVVTPHDGEVDHSSWNQKGFFIENKSLYGTTKFMYSRSDDVDRTDKFQQDQYYVYELQEYITLTHIMNYNGFIIMPSWQRFKEDIDRDSPESKDIKSTLDIFGINVSKKVNNLISDSDELKYGMTNHYENVDYHRGSDLNKYHYNTLSLWASYKETYDDWDYSLTYNFAWMDTSGGDIDRSMVGNALGFGLNYYVNSSVYLYTSLNSNFKFPTLTNLAEARSDSVEEIANKNLDSEKAVTFKVGLGYDKFSVSLFHKELYDMIIRVQTDIPDGYGNYKWRYENTDRGTIDGINLNYDNYFGNIRFRTSIEYLYGKTDYDYISKLQPFTSWTRLDYKKIYAEFLYAPKVQEDKMALKDQTDYRIQDHNYGYNILNVGYLYTIEQHNFEFKLDNILDSRGRVYGSSVDFNERVLRLEYLYKF